MKTREGTGQGKDMMGGKRWREGKVGEIYGDGEDEQKGRGVAVLILQPLISELSSGHSLHLDGQRPARLGPIMFLLPFSFLTQREKECV